MAYKTPLKGIQLETSKRPRQQAVVALNIILFGKHEKDFQDNILSWSDPDEKQAMISPALYDIGPEDSHGKDAIFPCQTVNRPMSTSITPRHGSKLASVG